MQFKEIKKRSNMLEFLNSNIKPRSFQINKFFVNKTVLVYNGKKYFKVRAQNIQEQSKYGEYSFTRKLGKIHTN